MNWETNFLQFKTKSNLDSIQANQLRQKAFDHFLVTGLPSKKEEAWKYTSLSAFKTIDWQAASEGEEVLSHEQLQKISKNLTSDFYNIVVVNGVLNKTLSDDLADEIQFIDVSKEDFHQNPDHVEKNILNLSEAFLAKKISIQIAKNQIFEKPVHLVFVQASKDSVFQSMKVNVNIGKNAELTLVVHTLSLDGSDQKSLNLNLNLRLSEEARVKLVQLQNEDVKSYQFSQTEVRLEDKAQFQALAMSLGGQLIRNYLHLDFKGRNAFAGVYGLTILNSEQHVDNYTFIQHSVGENQSVQHYKSILSGSSQSVFRGRVRIDPDAQKANSEQLNNNLLLTREAQAVSIPQLEIYADDVKAGHGSTIGQLNKDEIFYFLSRGINQYIAVKMLSYGYAKELIYKFENENLQKFIFKSLQEKLERMIQNV